MTEKVDWDPPLFHLVDTGSHPAHHTIPMILHCPECGTRHIDEKAFAKIPHHTHACQGCGMVWRPAKVNTHGVQFLPGYKNGDDDGHA
jgi:rubredoxin